jgi:hypothetical protein
MKKNYITQMPIPACVVGVDGRISKANSFIKNVFVYEDIVGSNFFALTGVRRENLLNANKTSPLLRSANAPSVFLG